MILDSMWIYEVILMIIDIHGHYYGQNLYPPWVPYGIKPLKKWAENVDIDKVVVSSLDVFDKGMDENKEVTYLCSVYPKLWQWLTIDPRVPNWWESLYNHEKVIGLKVHPTWHNYELTDYLYDILEVAKNNNWAVLTHFGVNEPYVNIEKSIKIADRYGEVPVIFAHLGNGFSSYGDVLTQVECLARTKNENTLIDTSSLAIHLNGLLKESVARIGSGRILFGTDLPLHLPESMLAGVSMADLSIEDKERILWKTAVSFIPKLKVGE